MKLAAIVIFSIITLFLTYSCSVSQVGETEPAKHKRYSSGMKYDHSLGFHGSAGECLGCHSGASKSRQAGYPKPEVCVECHSEADHDRERDESCAWCHFEPIKEKIERPLSPIYGKTEFSHKKHLENKKECAECHGEVGKTSKTSDIKMPDETSCGECH
ncbi:MAG: cytochrome c3 family protein [Planctomycetota bacterium]|jgi:hypothetical protein